MGRCVCKCKKDPLALVHPVLLKFPKDPEMRDRWIKAIKAAINFVSVVETSQLSSAHFREEDLYRTSFGCLRAKENAVPSIFETSPSRKQTSRSPSPRKKKESDPPSPPQPEESRNDSLSMTNVITSLPEEDMEMDENELKILNSQVEVIEIEHMYTMKLKIPDVQSDKEIPPPSPPEIIMVKEKFEKNHPIKHKIPDIQSDKEIPPPSPPEIIMVKEKVEKNHPIQIKKIGKFHLPAQPIVLPDSVTLSPLTHTTLTDTWKPDVITDTDLMMEFDRMGM
ncbi:hypothetical protein WDU94_012625 [Cyamophila willieti]